MTWPALVLTLIFPMAAQGETFDQFTFCRENAIGVYSRLCVEFNSTGQGTFSLEVRDEEAAERIPFAFSPPGWDEFEELLEDTGYLEEAERYESGRNVANLGTKTVSVVGDWGRREAVFNYTTIGEASRLTAFLERLLAQEVLRFEAEVALEFDRLGVPDQLEKIQAEIRANRIVEPGRIVALLDQIAADPRVVNYARSNAASMAEDLRKDLEDFD